MYIDDNVNANEVEDREEKIEHEITEPPQITSSVTSIGDHLIQWLNSKENDLYY